MDYRWAKNLYDSDGDLYEDCILVFIGDTSIIKVKDTAELEQFAHRILSSLPEIRESN